VIRHVGIRLAISAAIVFVVSFLTFLLEALAPGDVAQTILSQGNAFGAADPQAVQALRAKLGLDQPLLRQYSTWLGHAIHGDLGTSPISGLSVAQEISHRLPTTLSLVVLATAMTALAGVALGVLSAVRRGWLGRVVDVLSLLGSAVPVFWLALVLVTLFAVTVPVLPATGYVPLTESPSEWAASLVLPVATLALPGVALFAKHTRDAMREALASDFVTALRANGASERSLIFRHALRNAAIPLATVIGLTFIGLFSGTVFVEQVFAMPGLGGLATQATLQYDLPMVQGVVVVFTIVVVIVNLLVDLAYGWLNPKVRQS
jgi:peptide/nickel transport system permease protein